MNITNIIVLILFIIFMTWIIAGFNKTQFEKYSLVENKKKKKKKKKD